MKFARGYGKFAAIAATPLQYASAGDSPPLYLHLHFIFIVLGMEQKSSVRKYK